jgi:hypothetical protein
VEDVGIILGALDVDMDERERLLSLARDSETPQWVSLGPSEQQRQMATLLHYEQDADQITDVSQFIPGLLQTEDYARAVMRAGMVPADEIGTRVAIRLGRHDMLRTRSTKLIALIGEAALHYRVGGPDVLLDQLRYLLEVAAWDTVDLRIVPFATKVCSARSSSWTAPAKTRSSTSRHPGPACSCTSAWTPQYSARQQIGSARWR